MSVRAYRVNKVELQSDPTFNLWHSEVLMEYLQSETDLRLNEGGGGMLEIDIEVLKGALDLPELEQDIKDTLKQDIKWAEKNRDTHIDYMCF